MPFNEKNLKSLYDKRIDDTDSLCLKDEKTKAVRPVTDATGIVTESLELFSSKPIDYDFNADFLTP